MELSKNKNRAIEGGKGSDFKVLKHPYGKYGEVKNKELISEFKDMAAGTMRYIYAGGENDHEFKLRLVAEERKNPVLFKRFKEAQKIYQYSGSESVLVNLSRSCRVLYNLLDREEKVGDVSQILSSVPSASACKAYLVIKTSNLDLKEGSIVNAGNAVERFMESNSLFLKELLSSSVIQKENSGLMIPSYLRLAEKKNGLDTEFSLFMLADIKQAFDQGEKNITALLKKELETRFELCQKTFYK